MSGSTKTSLGVSAAAIRLWRRPAVTIGLFAYVIAALCAGALVIALHMPAFGARFDRVMEWLRRWGF